MRYALVLFGLLAACSSTPEPPMVSPDILNGTWSGGDSVYPFFDITLADSAGSGVIKGTGSIDYLVLGRAVIDLTEGGVIDPSDGKFFLSFVGLDGTTVIYLSLSGTAGDSTTLSGILDGGPYNKLSVTLHKQ